MGEIVYIKFWEGHLTSFLKQKLWKTEYLFISVNGVNNPVQQSDGEFCSLTFKCDVAVSQWNKVITETTVTHSGTFLKSLNKQKPKKQIQPPSCIDV